jgi:hypothetical protein
MCLDSPSHTSVNKGDESPNHANGIEEQAPEPLPQSNMVLRKRIRKIKQGMKRCICYCFQFLVICDALVIDTSDVVRPIKQWEVLRQKNFIAYSDKFLKFSSVAQK